MATENMKSLRINLIGNVHNLYSYKEASELQKIRFQYVGDTHILGWGSSML